MKCLRSDFSHSCIASFKFVYKYVHFLCTYRMVEPTTFRTATEPIGRYTTNPPVVCRKSTLQDLPFSYSIVYVTASPRRGQRTRVCVCVCVCVLLSSFSPTSWHILSSKSCQNPSPTGQPLHPDTSCPYSNDNCTHSLLDGSVDDSSPSIR